MSSDIYLNGITYPSSRKVAFPGKDGKEVVFTLPEDADAGLNAYSERPVQNKVIHAAIEDVRQRQTSPYNFKGSVADLASLPSSGNEVNDTYYVEAVKYRVTWTGEDWQQASMDESEYEDELSDIRKTITQKTLTSGWTLYKPVIENGSAASSSNAKAVHTEDYIPVRYGQLVTCLSPAVKSTDNFRSFGYITYDASKAIIRSVDYGTQAEKRNNLIVMTDSNVAFIRITIAEYVSSSHAAVTLRKTDYADNAVVVYVRDPVTSDTLTDNSLMDGTRIITDYRHGNYHDAGTSSPYLSDGDFNRLIPIDFIRVRRGDIIHVANGSYDHVFVGWLGDIGSASKWIETEFTSNDADYYVPYDGFFIVNFSDRNNKSAYVSFDAFDGGITVTSASQRMLDALEHRIKRVRVHQTLWFNGTWTLTGGPRMVANANRVGTPSFIPIYAGDIIHIRDGSYAHSIGLIAGTMEDYTIVRKDPVSIRDDDFVVREDGFMGVGWLDPNAMTSPISIDDFDGALYIDREVRILADNPQAVTMAMSGKKHYSYPATRAEARLNSPRNDLATFVHVSDVHGDSETFANAYEAADYVGATALIASGDLVYYYSTDDASYLDKVVSVHKTPYVMCMGNHDAFLLDAAGQNAKFIAPFAEGQGYNLPSGITSPTYFYKDFAAKKIRLISVNQFEYDGTGSTSDTRRHMTQEQLDWFCQTLLDTPAGYGVLVVCHSPEKIAGPTAGYTKFFQRIYGAFDLGISVLTDVVDAFIGGVSINKTYSNRSGTTPATITAAADFSGKNDGVEFIAYVNGHMHIDAVGYVPDTAHRQLQLNITCTNSWVDMNKNGTKNATGENDNPWLTEGSDLGRVEGTPSKDAINVYSIDRDAKAVRITRIGANMPNNLSEARDFMVIPYAE